MKLGHGLSRIYMPLCRSLLLVKTVIPSQLVFAEGYLDMLDTILLAAGTGFFVVAVLYVLACDRL